MASEGEASREVAHDADSSSSARHSSGSEEDDEEGIDELLDPDDDSPFEDEDFEAEDKPRAPKARGKVVKGKIVKAKVGAKEKTTKKRTYTKPGPAIAVAPSAYVPVWIQSKRPRELDPPGTLEHAHVAAMAFVKKAGGVGGSSASLTMLSSAYQDARARTGVSSRKSTRVVVVSDDESDQAIEEPMPCEFCGAAFPPAVLLNHKRRCQEEHVKREKLAFLAAKRDMLSNSTSSLGHSGSSTATPSNSHTNGNGNGNSSAGKRKVELDVINLSEEEEQEKAFWRALDERTLQQRAAEPQKPVAKQCVQPLVHVSDEGSGPVLISDHFSALRDGRTRVNGNSNGAARGNTHKEDHEDEGENGDDDDDGAAREDSESDRGESLMDKCENFAKEKKELLASASACVTEQPATLQKTLNDYQLTGLNWLMQLHELHLNGILADEMGLGKTVQTISLFAHLQARSEGRSSAASMRPHLVIVPATTLDNWRRELSVWCPSLCVKVYYGSQKEREVQKIALLRGMDTYDVLITTYNLAFQRADRVFLKRLQFEYLVLDEAHNVKNSASQRHQRLSRLPATRRLLLTGTPLQNNLGELWALLSFLMPRIFTNADAMPAVLKDGDAQQVGRMKAILAPFILRRLKSQVQQSLRHKTEQLEHVQLDAVVQAPLYRRLVARSRAEWAACGPAVLKGCDGNGDGAMDEGIKKGKEKSTSLINIIMQLQKACNHPCLTRVFYTSKDLTTIARALRRDDWQKMTQVEAEANLETYSDFELHNACLDYDSLADLRLPDEKLLYSSAKLVHLRTRLPQLRSEGHRVLLFSQMTRVLDILEVLLQRLDMPFLRLDGQTPVPDRQALIDRFNTDSSIPVFLLSTRAGGLGINLTSADTVVFFDSSFNPQQDRQAEDRCHRIGQKKAVTVYRLVCEGTLEEYILKRAADKLRLNDAILEEGTAAERKHAVSILEAVFK